MAKLCQLLRMSVNVAWSSSDRVVICYVLPVLWLYGSSCVKVTCRQQFPVDTSSLQNTNGSHTLQVIHNHCRAATITGSIRNRDLVPFDFGWGHSHYKHKGSVKAETTVSPPTKFCLKQLLLWVVYRGQSLWSTIALLNVNIWSAGDCNPMLDGQQYVGNTSVTVSNKQCQAWASQSPHEHSFNQVKLFPDSSITDASNYCRNPSSSSVGLWCYTMDPNTRWERCNVPICGQSVCFIKLTLVTNYHSNT